MIQLRNASSHILGFFGGIQLCIGDAEVACGILKREGNAAAFPGFGKFLL